MKKFMYVILIVAFLGIMIFAGYYLKNNETNKIAMENIDKNEAVNNNTVSNLEQENLLKETENNQVNENIESSESHQVEENIKKPISNPVVEVTSSNFETEVLKSDRPVLVDFYATWCGPCNYLSPILKEIADETPNLKVVKIDVDKEEMLAYQYRAFSLPTVVLFKNGSEATRFVGAAPKKAIIDYINPYL